MKNKKETLVIGIGGGGQNILNQLKEQVSDDFRLIVINSDEQILNFSDTDKILFPTEWKIFKKFSSKGLKTKLKYFVNSIFCSKPSLGCGGDVSEGEILAKKYKSLLKDELKKAGNVFVISTFGGGFGTGTTPVIVDYIKQFNINPITFITVPFGFEGKRRSLNADLGIEKLKNDNLVIINNDKCIEAMDKKVSAKEAFAMVNSAIITKVLDIHKKKRVADMLTKEFEE